ncbi:MAG: PASTA domain-containing protein [Verrucomicrobiota bacterium]
MGEDQATATDDLQAAGFDVEVTDRNTTDAGEDGAVLEQSPAAGDSARPGTTVTIYVGRLNS